MLVVDVPSSMIEEGGLLASLYTHMDRSAFRSVRRTADNMVTMVMFRDNARLLSMKNWDDLGSNEIAHRQVANGARIPDSVYDELLTIQNGVTICEAITALGGCVYGCMFYIKAQIALLDAQLPVHISINGVDELFPNGRTENEDGSYTLKTYREYRWDTSGAAPFETETHFYFPLADGGNGPLDSRYAVALLTSSGRQLELISRQEYIAIHSNFEFEVGR